VRHLDSLLPLSSGRFVQSADVLLDQNNMVVDVEISLVSCIQAEIDVTSNLFPVSAAICELRLILTSNSNRSLPVDISRKGIAVRIVFLSC